MGPQGSRGFESLPHRQVIIAMNWTEIKYKRTEVDRAGDVLINKNSTPQKVEQATNVLDNWRSAHSFPLHIFKKRLKEKSDNIAKTPSPLVVQRLKRNPAILKKLQRKYDRSKPTMKLSQMQDIGGCRSVLPNVDLARKLCNEYYHIDKNTKGKHCDLKHEFKNKKDYIDSPKDDGYRSIHLIYKYYSDKRDIYNGLQIEIQIRSKLQHIWATAVETVGHFTKQALKSNEGAKKWLRFFRLISAVFANIEGTTRVPNTPNDSDELYRQVKRLTKSLQVIEKINSWTKVLEFMGQREKTELHKPHFYLLELDIDNKQLTIATFEKNQEEKASTAYSKAEKRASLENPNKDIVLVEASTTKELKKAYPNYFLDMKEFTTMLKNYLDNPPSS